MAKNTDQSQLVTGSMSEEHETVTPVLENMSYRTETTSG